MSDDPVKALRDALTPVLNMHAERIRIGEPTNADRLLAAVLKHLPGVLDLLAAKEREVFELRSAVIDIADRFSSHYDERVLVRRIRAAANDMRAPFDFATATEPPPCPHIEVRFGGEGGCKDDCLRCAP